MPLSHVDAPMPNYLLALLWSAWIAVQGPGARHRDGPQPGEPFPIELAAARDGVSATTSLRLVSPINGTLTMWATSAQLDLKLEVREEMSGKVVKKSGRRGREADAFRDAQGRPRRPALGRARHLQVRPGKGRLSVCARPGESGHPRRGDARASRARGIKKRRVEGLWDEARASLSAELDRLLATPSGARSHAVAQASWKYGFEAERLADEKARARAWSFTLQFRRRTLPPDHRDLQWARGNFALTLKARGELAAARALEVKVLEARERTLTPTHGHLQKARINLSKTPREAASELAHEIAGRSPSAVRAAKKLLDASVVVSPAEGLALEAELQKTVIGKANQLEAVMSQMEKRAPNYEDPE